MKYLDANVLNRFILNDIPEQAQKAQEIIESGEAFVLPEVFAEVVYVLTRLYHFDRGAVADYLNRLLRFVSTTDETVLARTFENYKSTKLDFVDCILAAYNSEKQVEICSFDKKLNNFIARNGKS